ncbi:hypothetical protein M0P65_04715 [Candidatus Gracilibacteria bacterium]|nr:hypothetical protein [Candidatus Gracilibacteria bacterium]
MTQFETKKIENQENYEISQDKLKVGEFSKNLNSSNLGIITATLNTLPKMADYNLEKDEILGNTLQNTTKLKTSFQV